jgi:hypothetical protein
LVIPALVGCDPLTKGEFVAAYTTSLCEHQLVCGDQAEMTFDGISDVDACYVIAEPEVGRWGQGCRFRAQDAEACLADMALLQCPPAVGTLAERPLSCEEVYFRCDTVETPAPVEPTEPMEPEDTDAGSDTDAPAE